MNTPFAGVLATESVCLAAVTDGATLAEWRHRVVKEVMTPQSPYAIALRQAGDVRDRAEFLARWRQLIADAIARVVPCAAARPSDGATGESGPAVVDPQRTAVLILAALHGGCTLSQLAQDQWPLDAALDVALTPFAGPGSPAGADTSTVPSGQ
ncbi:hypothetical protein SAMN04487968_1205 [Nocardioides terrae]|uniref:Transcriptional repressor C-terminal n=1 Tax=Nocardioides terrae TaxID=574651 RepID=A0A1I1NRN1_9ACTN|nr:hypothetical protein [Nocardioides terrae]SFD00331.1 hypothetical protein SAMN04487968_1205 [Nocardioides terrae]